MSFCGGIGAGIPKLKVISFNGKARRLLKWHRIFVANNFCYFLVSFLKFQSSGAAAAAAAKLMPINPLMAGGVNQIVFTQDTHTGGPDNPNQRQMAAADHVSSVSPSLYKWENWRQAETRPNTKIFLNMNQCQYEACAGQ